MFTQLQDYSRLISEENLNVIIAQDTSLMRKMELTAQEEIESYLRHHFDVAKLFKGFGKYSPTVVYTDGDLVTFIDDSTTPTEESELYFAIADTSAGESPESAPTKWKKGDNRHQYLLTIFIDMMLYHAHSRISPRNIPDFRISRYDDAILWLKMVNSGKVSPDFPVKSDPTVADRNIHFGTSKIDTNTY